MAVKRRLRNIYLGFWLTTAEKTQVAHDARIRSLSLSDYMRDRLNLALTEAPSREQRRRSRRGVL